MIQSLFSLNTMPKNAELELCYHPQHTYSNLRKSYRICDTYTCSGKASSYTTPPLFFAEPMMVTFAVQCIPVASLYW